MFCWFVNFTGKSYMILDSCGGKKKDKMILLTLARRGASSPFGLVCFDGKEFHCGLFLKY